MNKKIVKTLIWQCDHCGRKMYKDIEFHLNQNGDIITVQQHHEKPWPRREIKP